MTKWVYSGTVNHWKAYVGYDVSSDAKTVKITASGGIQADNYGIDIGSGITTTVKIGPSGNYWTKSGSGGLYSPYGGNGYKTHVSGFSHTFNKGHSAQTVYAGATVVNSSGYLNGTATAWSPAITIPALASYSVKYNRNGGTGGPASAQTKWYGENLTLNSARPTKTGYSFYRWNTKLDGTGQEYAAGATYATNAAVTLYAQWTPWTYTVEYDRNAINSITNMPSDQTKTHGTTLKLSTAVPVRANYTFLGWNTKADGSGTLYSPGDNFATNGTVNGQKLKLYAQWKLAYISPTLETVSAVRHTRNTPDDEGTDVKVTANWSVDTGELDPNNHLKNYVISYRERGVSTWTQLATVTPSDTLTSGTIEFNTSTLDSKPVFDITKQYDIQVVLEDQHLTATRTAILTRATFVFDILAGGLGAAFGKPATMPGLLDIGWDVSTDGAFKSSADDIVLYSDKIANNKYRRWVFTSLGNLRLDTSEDGVTWTAESYYDRTPASLGVGGAGDYIVEVGSNSGTTANPQWRWIKFASGYAIAWGYYTGGKWAATDAWGSLYFKETSRVSNPFTWAGAPYEWMQPQGTAYFWCVGHNTATTTQTGTYYLVTPTKQTTQRAATLNFLQIGRWK